MSDNNPADKSAKCKPAGFLFLVLLVENMVFVVEMGEGNRKLICVLADVVGRFFVHCIVENVAGHYQLQDNITLGFGVDAGKLCLEIS